MLDRMHGSKTTSDELKTFYNGMRWKRAALTTPVTDCLQSASCDRRRVREKIAGALPKATGNMRIRIPQNFYGRRARGDGSYR